MPMGCASFKATWYLANLHLYSQESRRSFKFEGCKSLFPCRGINKNFQVNDGGPKSYILASLILFSRATDTGGRTKGSASAFLVCKPIVMSNFYGWQESLRMKPCTSLIVFQCRFSTHHADKSFCAHYSYLSCRRPQVAGAVVGLGCLFRKTCKSGHKAYCGNNGYKPLKCE